MRYSLVPGAGKLNQREEKEECVQGHKADEGGVGSKSL